MIELTPKLPALEFLTVQVNTGCWVVSRDPFKIRVLIQTTMGFSSVIACLHVLMQQTMAPSSLGGIEASFSLLVRFNLSQI